MNNHRLNGLRSERDSFVIGAPDGIETPAPIEWALENPSKAAELEALEAGETDTALSQANAQMESVRTMVAALECDYDRLEELRDECKDFAANWSLVGCLPDNEALLFDDEDDARQALVDELNERAEQDEESASRLVEDGVPDLASELTQRGERFASAARDVEQNDLSSIIVNGWHFWYTDDVQFKGLDSEDEYNELQELEEQANGCEDLEDAERAIDEDALSVEVCSDWHAPGGDSAPSEYRIVLCTGGPHVEIKGELNDHGEPTSGAIYYQDWGTLLTERVNEPGDMDALTTYAGRFLGGF